MKYRTFRNLLLGLLLAGGGAAAAVVVMNASKPEVPHRPIYVPPPATAPTAVAPVAVPPAAVPSEAGAGLRAVDRDALALLARPVQDKIKDGTRGKPYKINVYSDDGKRWNRLKVDLDRDETWDESWTIKKDGAIERKVGEGGGAQVHRLADGSSWQPIAP